MSPVKTLKVWLTALLTVLLAMGILFADDDKHGGHGKKGDDHSKGYASQVTNKTYADQCGSCHFAYQPWLLPSGSWSRLVSGLDKHFGTGVALSDGDKKEISGYLSANGADRAGGKLAGKIMRSLGGAAPLRVSEVPYIVHKHRKVSADVFRRQSVGGLGNCSACHTTAAQGNYDEHNVRIPQ